MSQDSNQDDVINKRTKGAISAAQQADQNPVEAQADPAEAPSMKVPLEMQKEILESVANLKGREEALREQLREQLEAPIKAQQAAEQAAREKVVREQAARVRDAVANDKMLREQAAAAIREQAATREQAAIKIQALARGKAVRDVAREQEAIREQQQEVTDRISGQWKTAQAEETRGEAARELVEERAEELAGPKKEIRELLKNAIKVKSKLLGLQTFDQEQEVLVDFMTEEIIWPLAQEGLLRTEVLKSSRGLIRQFNKNLENEVKTIQQFLHQGRFDSKPKILWEALRNGELATSLEALSSGIVARVTEEQLKSDLLASLKKSVVAAPGKVYGAYTAERDKVVEVIVERVLADLRASKATPAHILEKEKDIIAECITQCRLNKGLADYLKNASAKNLTGKEAFISDIAKQVVAKAYNRKIDHIGVFSVAETKALDGLKKEIHSVMDDSIEAKIKSKWVPKFADDFHKEKEALIKGMTDQAVDQLTRDPRISVAAVVNCREQILSAIQSNVAEHSENIHAFLHQKEFDDHPEKVTKALEAGGLRVDLLDGVMKDLALEQLRTDLLKELKEKVAAAPGKIYGKYTAERDKTIEVIVDRVISNLRRNKGEDARAILDNQQGIIMACSLAVDQSQDLTKHLKVGNAKNLTGHEKFIVDIVDGGVNRSRAVIREDLQKDLAALKKEVRQVVDESVESKLKSQWVPKFADDFHKEKTILVDFMTEEIIEDLSRKQGVTPEDLRANKVLIMQMLADNMAKEGEAIHQFLHQTKFDHHPEVIKQELMRGRLVLDLTAGIEDALMIRSLRPQLLTALKQEVKAAPGKVYGAYTAERDKVLVVVVDKVLAELRESGVPSAQILNRTDNIVKVCAVQCKENRGLQDYLQNASAKKLTGDEAFISDIATQVVGAIGGRMQDRIRVFTIAETKALDGLKKEIVQSLDRKVDRAVTWDSIAIESRALVQQKEEFAKVAAEKIIDDLTKDPRISAAAVINAKESILLTINKDVEEISDQIRTSLSEDRDSESIKTLGSSLSSFCVRGVAKDLAVEQLRLDLLEEGKKTIPVEKKDLAKRDKALETLISTAMKEFKEAEGFSGAGVLNGRLSIIRDFKSCCDSEEFRGYLSTGNNLARVHQKLMDDLVDKALGRSGSKSQMTHLERLNQERATIKRGIGKLD